MPVARHDEDADPVSFLSRNPFVAGLYRTEHGIPSYKKVGSCVRDAIAVPLMAKSYQP